jgi:hypothetical protein
VDFVNDSGTGGPYSTAARSSAGDGSTITFQYEPSEGDGIAPGETSDIILVKTNASSYDEDGDASFIDGGGANIDGVLLEPAGPMVVPEPMSLGLLAIGGVICAARRPRRA